MSTNDEGMVYMGVMNKINNEGSGMNDEE